MLTDKRGFLSLIFPILIAVIVIGAIGSVFYYERTAQPQVQSPQETASQTTQPPPQQPSFRQPQPVGQSGLPPQPGNQGSSANYPIRVKTTGAQYKSISSPSQAGGSFTTGQDADIMLSGIGFNETGGPLLFNHPGGIATDGVHLILADGNNNRILIWNSPPGPNSPPDLVLGQKNFSTNAAGHGLDGLNWPKPVSVGGGKLVVADTDNNRILIWNTFPTRNGQPADLEIVDQGIHSDIAGFTPLRSIIWPWGVWTDGKKLAISSTGGSYVLVWNTFPTRDNQPADLYLTASGQFGTPRAITSDGKRLMVGDHNAKNENTETGTFVWNTFPTRNDQSFDYFIPSNAWSPQGSAYWRGTILPNGKTILLGTQLFIFNSFPTSGKTRPDLTLGGLNPYSKTQADLDAGDGGGVAVVGSKLFLSLYNSNKILVYNSVPNTSAAEPDYAIGSPDPYTNTLYTNYFFGNPGPATDGKHLFVASDFDDKLYVYKNIPDQSGAYPDFVYDFRGINFGPWGISFYNNTLALAGSEKGSNQGVYIWTRPPTDGHLPDLHFFNHIGSAVFKRLQGVAMDEKHFYLADSGANKIYVWNGIPSENTDPAIILSIDQPNRLSSDGKYLVVAASLSPVGHVGVYTIANLSSVSKPTYVGIAKPWSGKSDIFNLPQDVIVAGGHLFVADSGNNRVVIWNSITSALNNAPPDVFLGCVTDNTDVCSRDPEIGKNTLFGPDGLAFDGKYLWVGEFKFSGRLLRFSAK